MSKNARSWFGICGGHAASVLSVVNGVLTGFVQTSSETYELVPQNGARCLLHEIDQEGYAPEQQPAGL